MHIAIIIPTNRPRKFFRFADSLSNLGEFAENIHVHASIQHPWMQDELEMMISKGAIQSYSSHSQAKPTRMVEWRFSGMRENQDADYFLFMDDDHQFSNPSKTARYQMSCEEYYRTSFEFLENNQDVGVLCLRGSLGGSDWGYGFRKTPKNGLVSTDKGGMIVRNIGIERICPVSILENRGALFESVMAYNVMSCGYKNSKRFNCPTKSEAVGSIKHIGGSRNVTYSDNVVDENNNKYIREKFCDPTWNHSSKKYPKGILELIKYKGWEYNEY